MILGGMAFECACDDESEAEKFVIDNPKREYVMVPVYEENASNLVVSYDTASAMLIPYGLVNTNAALVLNGLRDYEREGFTPFVIPVFSGTFIDFIKNKYYPDCDVFPEID